MGEGGATGGEGRAALVTGGHRGIGLGIARALVDAGWRVALTAEVPADAPEVRVALESLDGRASYHRHDLRECAGGEALLDAAEAAVGPLATFVGNAGVPSPRRGDLLDVSPEAFDGVMAVNLRGGFFLAQAAARRLLARGRDGPYRSMLLVTSVSAELASPERAEYCLSKAGASMMARLFALRLAADGIGVFELRPGVIDTPMTAGVHEAWSARIAAGLVPAGRWGEPADVGRAAVPLARGDMAFSTGAAFAVDGGLALPAL